MNTHSWAVLILLLSPAFVTTWKTSQEERRQVRQLRKGGVHYHAKRHMLPSEAETKRRLVSINREVRKKPSGHLSPLQEDELDNDEVVSVAIGPPPMHPKYDKTAWKHSVPKQPTRNLTNCTQGVTLVKDVLTELGREFLTKQVNEDFVFGQYVGNAMRNLTGELRLRMQHEVLDLVVKYQRLNRGDTSKPVDSVTQTNAKTDKKIVANDTEEAWPDFTNLAKIVG